MVSSMSAMRGMPKTMTTYAATKAGVAHLAEGLRNELYGTPIKVTVLYPGYIASEMNEQVDPQSIKPDGLDREGRPLDGRRDREAEGAAPACPRSPGRRCQRVMKHAPLPVLKPDDLSRVAGAQPIVFWPSIASRMMSAWPACWVALRDDVQDHPAGRPRRPGSNHGASGSGCAGVEVDGRDQRVGRAATFVVARRAGRRGSRPPAAGSCRVSSESPLARSPSPAAPSATKLDPARSIAATCLIRPPEAQLADGGAARACSSVIPWTVCRRNPRCLARVSRRSILSWLSAVSVIRLSSLVVMAATLAGAPVSS